MLELGIRNPIGGIADKTLILHKNEILFTNWLNFAQKSKFQNSGNQSPIDIGNAKT